MAVGLLVYSGMDNIDVYIVYIIHDYSILLLIASLSGLLIGELS